MGFDLGIVATPYALTCNQRRCKRPVMRPLVYEQFVTCRSALPCRPVETWPAASAVQSLNAGLLRRMSCGSEAGAAQDVRVGGNYRSCYAASAALLALTGVPYLDVLGRVKSWPFAMTCLSGLRLSSATLQSPAAAMTVRIIRRSLQRQPLNRAYLGEGTTVRRVELTGPAYSRCNHGRQERLPWDQRQPSTSAAGGSTRLQSAQEIRLCRVLSHRFAAIARLAPLERTLMGCRWQPCTVGSAASVASQRPLATSGRHPVARYQDRRASQRFRRPSDSRSPSVPGGLPVTGPVVSRCSEVARRRRSRPR